MPKMNSRAVRRYRWRSNAGKRSCRSLTHLRRSRTDAARPAREWVSRWIETTSSSLGRAPPECIAVIEAASRRLRVLIDRSMIDARCDGYGADDRCRRNWLRDTGPLPPFRTTPWRGLRACEALARLLCEDGPECIGEMDAWGVGWALTRTVASRRSQRRGTIVRAAPMSISSIPDRLCQKHCGRSSTGWVPFARQVISAWSISSWSVARSLVRSRCN